MITAWAAHGGSSVSLVGSKTIPGLCMTAPRCSISYPRPAFEGAEWQRLRCDVHGDAGQHRLLLPSLCGEEGPLLRWFADGTQSLTQQQLSNLL